MARKGSCGPDNLDIKFKDPDFEDVCKEHDADYDEGELSRREADLLFLQRMLNEADGFWDRLRAYIYYFFVRIFGWTRYKK